MDEHYDPDLDYVEPGKATAPALEIDPAKLQHFIDVQRTRQHLPLGIVAGLTGALVGAGIWVGITVVTNFQIGWMAVGVGFLVGIMVRVGGRGIDPVFGVAGAALALLGCAIGNFLSGCWFLAGETADAGFADILLSMTPGLALEIAKAMFSPVDLIFYGIALFEGYRFSIRRLTRDELEQLALSGPTPGPSNQSWAA